MVKFKVTSQLKCVPFVDVLHMIQEEFCWDRRTRYLERKNIFPTELIVITLENHYAIIAMIV